MYNISAAVSRRNECRGRTDTEPVKIDLQFVDKGFGITHFSQKIGSDTSMEITTRGNAFGKHEGERVNAMAAPAWEWVCRNGENIRDYLAQRLSESFGEMRRKKEKHVPEDDPGTIRGKLGDPYMIVFHESNVFEIFYWAWFSGAKYSVYVTVNTDSLTFKNAGILTMGGFRPPKGTKGPDLRTAAALYAYHLENGNTKELYRHYAALPAGETPVFIDMFCADSEDIEDRIDLLLYLALFSHACGEKLPDKLYRFLLDSEVFYYGEVYLRADEKFADELIAVLAALDDKEAHQVSANHVLCALSAIPCKKVNDFLVGSSKKPLPAWAKKLHILPMEYAQVCGWEAVENGEPRKLTDEAVTAFERCDKSEASPRSPMSSLDDSCAFCGQPLTLVFDAERKLAACLHCSCYQTVYMKEENGTVRWHNANTPGEFFTKHPKYMKNDEDIAAQFGHGVRPSKEERHAIWTAHQFAEIDRTQIGGMPTAVNDVIYPKCPDCGKIMRFAAQFCMDDFDSEGVYYFFVCECCGVTAANFDQT